MTLTIFPWKFMNKVLQLKDVPCFEPPPVKQTGKIRNPGRRMTLAKGCGRTKKFRYGD